MLEDSTKPEFKSCVFCEEAVNQMFLLIVFPGFIFLLYKRKNSRKTDARSRPGLEQLRLGAFRNLYKFDRGMQL